MPNTLKRLLTKIPSFRGWHLPHRSATTVRTKGQPEDIVERVGPTAFDVFPFNEDIFSRGLEELYEPTPFAVDVKEHKKKWAVDAALPGYDLSDIQLRVINNEYLEISANKEETSEEDDPDSETYRKEMIFGQVHRLMRLPENILPEGIRSSHKNGVLHVDIPKGEESEKKEKVAEISISSSE